MGTCYTLIMNRQEVFATSIVVMISVISIMFLFIAEPEEARTESADSVVTVEGEWRADQPVVITELGDGHYELAPEVLTAANPVTVTFAINDTEHVYQWDDAFSMWEEVDHVLRTGRLGTFWVTTQPEIDAPDFISQYDQLLQMAPAGTVGYEIAVGVLTENGDVFRVAGKGDVGGCGGVIGHGDVTERSELEHDTRVLVDDVETLVHFLFVGQWIVDESGCAQGESLQSVL